MAYLLEDADLAETFDTLDYREKNGYERCSVSLELTETSVDGVVYIATRDNFAFLGEASLNSIAEQIRRSVGPSGRNIDYLFDLADALRNLDVEDEHVYALEALVRKSVI